MNNGLNGNLRENSAGGALLEKPAREKEPESKVRIRFVDCDPYGHLNNGRYLDYFISAREEQLMKHYDLDIYGEQYKEAGWVVRSSHLTHLLPALNNQQVIIKTRLLNYSRSNIVVEFLMLNEDKTKVHATAWLDFRYINFTTGKPARHETHSLELFEAIHLGVDFRPGGERERLKNIRQSFVA